MAETLSNGFTFDQEVELCELYWPGQLASRKTSKSRHHLRKRAADKCLTDFYLKTGRTCRTCANRRGKICDLYSDFFGTVTIKLEGTCTAHDLRSS